ncbi:RNA 2',3'-cyclic phosphodiesterase [Nitrosomonas halophila]|uniref:RNA 2',3'-cyclic phosphodiesterase n=1 Tax=Nitrosomonas halophila TaxID=44576 RepID=A0A1H3CNW3_9PROT|nr:RNA 2',3'-cyclic phosphodiesterase [Nitrosomonas halophila]SDX55843.1 2'-5' RNA ligase [Nitrosomonas halophila]
MLKIFLALWPLAATRRQLDQLARQLATGCRGRSIRAENLHLTLLFIGEVAPDLLPKLSQAASAVKQAAFHMTLDEIRYWKREGIVVAGMQQPPAALLELVQALRQAYSTMETPFDDRPFKPHVTLVRNAKCRLLPDSMPAIDWEVAQWSLVQSLSTPQGVVYRSLANWLLEPSGP